MESGEFGALLVMEMLPEALPAVVGENFAVKEVDWPAAIVAGVERPVMVKPAPETLAWEMLMLAEPELVKVTVEEPDEPTFTLLKLTAAGLEVRLPCTPEPLSGIESVELFAELLMVMEPEAAPAAVGTNCAEKFTV